MRRGTEPISLTSNRQETRIERSAAHASSGRPVEQNRIPSIELWHGARTGGKNIRADGSRGSTSGEIWRKNVITERERNGE